MTDPSTGAPVAPDDGTPVTAQDYATGLERECDPTLSRVRQPELLHDDHPGYCDLLQWLRGPARHRHPGTAGRLHPVQPDLGHLDPGQPDPGHQPDQPGGRLPEHHVDVLRGRRTAVVADLHARSRPATRSGPTAPTRCRPTPRARRSCWSPTPTGERPAGPTPRATSWSHDPIHHRYVAQISIDETLGSDAAADEVQQEIQAGTLDLEWNTTVPASSLPSLADYTNALFGSFPSPGITNPYLVFNLQADTPLKNVAVRQALEYAINKVALAKIYGGSDFNVPLNQVFGPGAEGYISGYDPYPTANNEGDATKCKSLLKAAGYANGFTITDFYRTDGNHPAIFQEVQKDFGACGVTVTGKGISQGYYTATGILQTSASALASSGWDITEPGWVPDWYGPASARSILPDLFASSDFPGTNWGDFSSSTVDGLITKAESATTLSASTTDWQAANKAVMEQAPFIPFMGQLTNLMHSKTVHNALYNPFSAQYNLADIWLS